MGHLSLRRTAHQTYGIDGELESPDKLYDIEKFDRFRAVRDINEASRYAFNDPTYLMKALPFRLHDSQRSPKLIGDKRPSRWTQFFRERIESDVD